MVIFNKIYSALHNKRIERLITNYSKYGDLIQSETLKKIIKKNYNTLYAQRYGLNKDSDYNEFSKKIPIIKYEDIKEYIDLTLKGFKNILTKEEIISFAKSAGTTSKSKYIPISKEFLKNCHYKGGKDVLSFYLANNPNSKIFKGKSLTLPGTFDLYNKNKFFIGDLSASLVYFLPLWAKIFKEPNKKLIFVQDFEQKISKIIKNTKNKNIVALFGSPVWFKVLLSFMINHFKINYISEIWPNLELFVHGGVSISPYFNELKKLIAKEINYLEVYNASEGFFAFQNDLSYDDLLLCLDYDVFYEFIPLSDINKNNYKVLNINNIEENKIYSLVITTSNGLWRYAIGDLLKITKINPIKIKLVGRTQLFLNTFGEELTIEQIETALKETCNKTEAIVNEFCIHPVIISDSLNAGYHLWLIEFKKQPTNFKTFYENLDTVLKNINSDYEAKRYKNITLKEPKIIALKINTFYTWLKSKNKLGGQNKVPRIIYDENIVKEIINISNSLL